MLVSAMVGRVGAAVWALWSLAVPLGLMWRTGEEDRVLRASLGAEWEAYAERTPYKLVPYVF